MSGGFSAAFGKGFDTIRQHLTPPPVHAFMADRPPLSTDHANEADIWVDTSRVPMSTWIYYQSDPQSLPAWHLFAEFRTASSFLSSHRLWEAALLMAIRNYQIMNSALGVAGGNDLGSIYVGRVDQDYARLIKDYRGKGLPLYQEWPTVAQVQSRLQMSDPIATDVALQNALDAGIEQVKVDCETAWGVA
jgi:hypothetical protein